MLANLLLLWALQGPFAEKTSSLAEAARVARLELVAAESDRPYLVIRVATSTIELRMRGVNLRSVPVDALELGAVIRTSTSEETLEPLFTCRPPERPPRKEIVPGGAPTSTSAAGPAPDAGPMEATRTKNVTVTCEPALTIRLVARSEAGSLSDFAARIRRPGDPGGVRLRVVLDDAALESLIPALPETCFVLFDRGARPES